MESWEDWETTSPSQSHSPILICVFDLSVPDPSNPPNPWPHSRLQLLAVAFSCLTRTLSGHDSPNQFANDQIKC